MKKLLLLIVPLLLFFGVSLGETYTFTAPSDTNDFTSVGYVGYIFSCSLDNCHIISIEKPSSTDCSILYITNTSNTILYSWVVSSNTWDIWLDLIKNQKYFFAVWSWDLWTYSSCNHRYKWANNFWWFDSLYSYSWMAISSIAQYMNVSTFTPWYWSYTQASAYDFTFSWTIYWPPETYYTYHVNWTTGSITSDIRLIWNMYQGTSGSDLSFWFNPLRALFRTP